MLREQRETNKRRKLVEDDDVLRTWLRSGIAVPWARWDAIDRGETNPPIEAHWSHVLIACGGYGGCVRCGAVAGGSKNKALSGDCRKHCPRGSRGPIGRLARGHFPHPQRGMGQIWVDGSINPTPVKWCIDRRNIREVAVDANGSAELVELDSYAVVGDGEFPNENAGAELPGDATVALNASANLQLAPTGPNGSSSSSSSGVCHGSKRSRFRF